MGRKVERNWRSRGGKIVIRVYILYENMLVSGVQRVTSLTIHTFFFKQKEASLNTGQDNGYWPGLYLRLMFRIWHQITLVWGSSRQTPQGSVLPGTRADTPPPHVWSSTLSMQLGLQKGELSASYLPWATVPSITGSCLSLGHRSLQVRGSCVL